MKQQAPGRERPLSFASMLSVGLKVSEIIDQVSAGGGKAKCDEHGERR
jgi:hypothetical protein